MNDKIKIDSSSNELEHSFLNNPADALAIYQLKRTEETRDLRFEPLNRIQAVGLTVDRANYELVYTAPLPTKTTATTQDYLNVLYQEFNIAHPAGFIGHSLSISDVVALKQAGIVSSHYVDRIGFTELPSFLESDNPLRNAEMAMENDYGMIDGIVNNAKSPAMKDAEKPCILDQLKARPKGEIMPPRKRAEQER